MSVSFLLAGRVLLIFLFLGFIELYFSGILEPCSRVCQHYRSSYMCHGGCRFKAKWSAAFLVLVLSVFNVFTNNWWSVDSAHQCDFLK